MKRREFSLLTGSALLSTTAVGYFQKPSVAVEFNIGGVAKRDPSNVDSVIIEFNRFDITPFYLDESSDLSVTVKLDISDRKGSSWSNSFEFKNGESISVDSSYLSKVQIDEVDTSDSSIMGEVRIYVDHPDISGKSYRQTFDISQSIPSSAIEGFEDGDADDWEDPLTAVSSTSNGESPYSGSYMGELEIINGNNKTGLTKPLSENIYPTNMSVACRTENVDGTFDRLYFNLGPFFISLRSDYENLGIDSLGNTNVKFSANKWYLIEFNEIDWVDQIVGEVLINGSNEFTNYGFSGDGVNGYDISGKGGSTFQCYIDSIELS